MAGALKNYLGSLLGLLYLAGGLLYGGNFHSLDAFDWTVTLSFMTLGAFFLGISLLTLRADEDGLEILVNESESLSIPQHSHSIVVSPNFDKEVETILETGQSTLLKISLLAEIKKKNQVKPVLTT